uniref:Uncharacterized protein n=1 Tax=Rhizophora mucronata TaxID=61149 RepID=A0A2P2NUU7_RHIMU
MPYGFTFGFGFLLSLMFLPELIQ